MSGIDENVKNKLNIKYKDAKKLVEEARDVLGSDATDDQIIQEACDIFEDMPKQEQEAMETPIQSEEPEWKRKAKEQAARREAEWEEEERQKKLRAAAEARGEIPEGPGYGVTTVTKSTTRTTSKTSKVVNVKPEGPRTEFGGATVSCCVVM